MRLIFCSLKSCDYKSFLLISQLLYVFIIDLPSIWNGFVLFCRKKKYNKENSKFLYA
jgi:hypothetical protein